LEAGARRIVVVRAILDAEDPEKAAQAFRERLYGVA
ncbi:MAG: thiamine phosphate synthase, partial [Thermus caldifontis]